ncbi:MAG: ImmA/IrrE family metallo-endopeptidase [Prevotella sp.]|nr:ImmA/IrrE family metallo-endopeptidase [Prevotella sp.]
MDNTDNLKYFNQPQEADKWVWRIEHGVAEWIKKKNDKSYWKLVFWVSKTHLKILNERITIPEFAKLLIEECPHIFRDEETKETLFHSMEKFRYNRELNDFDKEHNIYVSALIDEAVELLTKDVEKAVAPTLPTLQQRMQKYVSNAMATGSYDRVCVNHTYDGQRVSLSVEKYVSQKFRDEERYSHVIVFQCVEEAVTADIVYSLQGQFTSMSSLPSKKLYIVSTCSYPKKIQDQAGKVNIGLVMVNLEYEVDENCFVLPRSPERTDYYYWRQMISGERPMTRPIIACDPYKNALEGTILYFSLADLLIKNNVSVNRSQKIKAPVLSNDDIEEIALGFIKSEVDELVSLLQRCEPNDKLPPCAIDPYKLAKSMGLRIERGYTGDKSALIDFEDRKVIISNEKQFFYHSARFDTGHEVGHYVLHYDVMAHAKAYRQIIHPNENDWMERQANHFAACLLMPAPVVRLLFDHFMIKHLGTVYYPLQANSGCTVLNIITPIAKAMNMSVEAATIRLKKLGLIYNQPPLPRCFPLS